MSKKELVPAGTSANALANPNSEMFSEFAGAGMENVTAGDMLVPRLALLQALSPQLKPRDPAFIEGASIGDICEVGTGTLFKEPILFLPVYYKKEYLEWAPRASGLGLVEIHSDASILDQTTRDDKRKAVLPNGNHIIETAQFYGFNLSNDRQRCFLPMASTQLKKARKWITLAAGERLKRNDGSEYLAPLFYRTYTLGSADESNNEGDWAGWTVERGPALPDLDLGFDWTNLAREAVDFRNSLTQGDVRGDMASMAEEAGVNTRNSETEAM